jgi:membrane protein YdbS with pleckstrin-like domain
MSEDPNPQQNDPNAATPPPAASTDAAVDKPADPYSAAATKHDDSDVETGEIWSNRPSFKTLLGQWGLYLIVVLAAIIGLMFVPAEKGSTWSAILNWFRWLIVILPLLWLAGKTLYLRWSLRYRLTPQRLFIDRGILSRTTDQLELIRVDDISVRRSIIDRMVGLGNVIVRSTDASDPELTIRGVPGADEVAEHIRTHMRRLRGRGLYVESL